MSTKNIFYNTLILSIVVQVITGIIEIGSLFVNVKVPLIKQLLVLEKSESSAIASRDMFQDRNAELLKQLAYYKKLQKA